MKLDGAIGRVLSQLNLKNRETEVPASLIDFVVAILLVSTAIFAALLLIHTIRQQTPKGFDIKDNILMSFFTTIILSLIAFLAYIIIVANT